MFKYRSIISIVLIAGIVMFLASISNAAVEMGSFTASWAAGNNPVELSWQTASEFDISAFNVWRSTVNIEINNDQLVGSGAVKISSSVIPANTPCSGTSNSYNYTDNDPTLDINVTYYYYLEVFKCNSAVPEFYGDGQPANPSGNGVEVNNGNIVSTATPLPTHTPTNTPPPTVTSVGATATTVPATATTAPATATTVPATATATAVPATATPTPSGSTLYLPIMMKN